MENRTDLPISAQQHLDRAYAYEDDQDLGNALRECESAIQLMPDLAEAYNLRGIVLEEMGRKEQAIAAYREAVRLAPDFQEAQENLREAEREIRPKSGRKRAATKYGLSGCALGFIIPVVIIAILVLFGVDGRISDAVASSFLFLMPALGIIGYIYGWSK